MWGSREQKTDSRRQMLPAFGPVLVLLLALAIGCGREGQTPIAKDAAGSDAGMNASDGDDGLDGSATEGGAPLPCAANGPPIELVCNGYCMNVDTACTGANMQFASLAECVDACMAPTWSCGTPADSSGNTIFCRIGHAMAATATPDTECPQAGPNSASCI